jgi:predicted type IV restriction endonuclease
MLSDYGFRKEFMIDTLNFPEPSPNIDIQSGKIWDVVRRRWLKYTPEEWVRQHLVLFLHHHRGFPLECFALEKEIAVAGKKKRFDVLVYRQAKAFMLIECKAIHVPLQQKTLDQVGYYNMALNVPIMVLTNGIQHYVCELKEGGEWGLLDNFPSY